MESKKSGIDARRTPRRVFNRAIGILQGGQYAIQQALQLSEGGMLFMSDFVFAKDAHIVATLVLPGGDTLVVRGQILYSKPAGRSKLQYGVRFDGVGIQHKRMIRNYVSAKTQAEAELENETRQ